jgi:hypothetical protein
MPELRLDKLFPWSDNPKKKNLLERFFLLDAF